MKSQTIQPFFHPQPITRPSPEYSEYMRVRQKILDIIRKETPEKTKVLNDIVEVLLENDKDIPTGWISGLLTLMKLGKKYRELRKRRKLYRKVVASILEQIFDPGLEYKMTKKDISDAFEACGLGRNKVAGDQINQIYVKVIHMLQVGELRDLTFEEQLHQYIRLKLYEIKISRQDWELNGR